MEITPKEIALYEDAFDRFFKQIGFMPNPCQSVDVENGRIISCATFTNSNEWIISNTGISKTHIPTQQEKPTEVTRELQTVHQLFDNATFGFEATALVRNYKDDKYGKPTGKTVYDTKKAGRLLALDLEKLYPDRPILSYSDYHCVEIASPIFNSFVDALNWYRSFKQLCRKHKLKTKDPQTVDGGCHMHFGFREFKDNLFYHFPRLYRKFATYPWIPWMFSEPDDTNSCDTIVNKKTYSKISAELYFDMLAKITTKQKFHDYKLTLNNKWMALSLRYDRIEYRCIEMPKNVHEFIQQYNFFNKLTRYMMLGEYEDKPVKLLTESQLQRISRKQCIREFKQLLDTLELPYEQYHKFVERNLLPRWELGRKRV